jgi:phage-related minor tail protein
MHHIKEYFDFINEAKRRSFSEINKETEDLLKNQIKMYTDLMKNNPDKIEIYKARLELTHAKLNVLTAKKQLDQLKGRS